MVPIPQQQQQQILDPPSIVVRRILYVVHVDNRWLVVLERKTRFRNQCPAQRSQRCAYNRYHTNEAHKLKRNSARPTGCSEPYNVQDRFHTSPFLILVVFLQVIPLEVVVVGMDGEQRAGDALRRVVDGIGEVELLMLDAALIVRLIRIIRHRSSPRLQRVLPP